MNSNVCGAALLLALSSTHASAAGKGHGAHDHGHAHLNIAVEGSKATVQFESPAECVYGFEYEAKDAKDIAQRDAGVKNLTDQIASLVVFDASLKCTATATKVEPFVIEDHHEGEGHKSKAKGDKKKGHAKHKEAKHGTHSDVRAEFAFTCAAPIAGTKLTFAFGKVFPKIKELKVQVVGDKQVGADIDDDKGFVQL